ncbi:B3 domain-containing protein Os01g0723500-like isoform X1 [Alnus glutinosa]|uniref:B3 domain-containing protein Os01g0723500-like isoform X1 n=1 Tax=Alnus glutinosa TaxID=3517 RepID=UPI002D765E8D|nr:B3 domain-containing protein Os01g0723500-like isoform X1 [Alnus glutinosa]
MTGEIHEDMDEFEDNRPCFFKLIFGGFNTEQLRIPRKFVKHLPKELPDQAILRDSSGDEWRVKLCKTVEDIYLQDGWKQYFEDHSLGDNEFLLFKHNGEMSFDVLIFGKDGCERVYASINKHTPVHDEADQLTKLKEKDIQRRKKLEEKEPPTQKRKVWKMAESFTSDFPYFKRCMTKSHVEKVFILRVPAVFAKEHLPPQGRAKIVVRNSEDKSWEVNYVSNGWNHVLSGGFKAFVLENKLKIGDICIFELLGKQEIRVHIFR